MRDSSGLILITGGTGLVGGELLRRLAVRRFEPVPFAIVRGAQAGEQLLATLRVRSIVCDLADPHLTLPRTIADRVVAIIHCAADTRFDLTLDEARAANVGATAGALAIASRCPQLERFAHISTVYVAGRATGVLGEKPCQFADGFSNTYQQAKREAEEVVLSAAGSIPVAVFRLSSIIGDSRDGHVSRFNYVHQLMRLFPWNVLPMIPLNPAAPVDLIPTDWAADALIHLIEKQFVPGRIYQVCAGAAESMPAGELIKTTARLLCEFGAAARIVMPEFVTQREYDAWAERARAKGDRLLKEFLRVLSFSLPHLGIFQSFENVNCRDGMIGSGRRLPSIRDYYPKVVEHCVKTQWGRGSRAFSPSAPRQHRVEMRASVAG